MNLALKCVLPWHSKAKTEKDPPPNPYALIMDNLESSLAITVDKSSGNTCGDIVERFIKPIEPTMFGHPVYSLDGLGPSIYVSVLHDEFFNGDFAIWIGGKHFNTVSVDQLGCMKYGGP